VRELRIVRDADCETLSGIADAGIDRAAREPGQSTPSLRRFRFLDDRFPGGREHAAYVQQVLENNR
jgi:hypothetical protein